MHCTNHPKSESTGACVECGKLFCDECIILVGRKRYCKDCASEILNEGNKSNTNVVITQQTTNIQKTPSQDDIIETYMNKETIGNILKYSVSLFYAFVTVGVLSEGNPIFLFMLFISLIWFPPFETWMYEKRKITIPLWLKIVFIIVSFGLIANSR